MLALINKILGMIPGNGYKTYVGLFLTVLSQIPTVNADPRFQVLAQVLQYFGIGMVAVGGTHKVTKVLDKPKKLF